MSCSKSGKYIKKIRKITGLTQKQFANEIQIAQSNISDLENDKYDITLSKFIKICRHFKIKDFNLIFEKDNS